MRNNLGHFLIKATLTFCILLYQGVVYSQDYMAIPGPPEFSLVDKNGVNVSSGNIKIDELGVSIGSGEVLLEHRLMSYTNNLNHFADNFSGGLFLRTNDMSTIPKIRISLGNIAESGYQYKNGNNQYLLAYGGTVEQINSYIWKYKSSKGIEIEFDSRISYSFDDSRDSQTYEKVAVATKLTYPSGNTVEINFKSASYNEGVIHRIQSVTSSAGYQLHYKYNLNSSTIPSFSTDKHAYYNWKRPTSVTAFNKSYDFCASNAITCDFTHSWPTVNFEWTDPFVGGDTIITFPNSTKKTFKHEKFCSYGDGRTSCPGGLNNSRVTKITDTSSKTAPTREYNYTNTYRCTYINTDSSCQVFMQGVVYKSKINDETRTYTYQFKESQYSGSYNRSDGPVLIVVNDSASRMVGFRDESTGLSGTYDHKGRIDSVQHNYGSGIILSEGLSRYTDKVENFEYDNFGNLILSTRVSVDGTSQSYSAGYENTCNNMYTRGKPSWIEDRKGNRTNFTYHCTSGKIAKVTKPSVNGIKVEKRYFYSQFYPYVKNSSGNLIRTNRPIWVLERESFCQSGNPSGDSCASSDDEVVTEYVYANAGEEDSLLLRGISITDVGSNITRRTCFEYDIYGNKIAEIKPKANLTSCQ